MLQKLTLDRDDLECVALARPLVTTSLPGSKLHDLCVAVDRFSIDIDDAPTESGAGLHRQRQEVARKLNELSATTTTTTIGSDSDDSDDGDDGDVPPVPVPADDSDDESS
jgi:hypothetical protein